jgi:spectinomycin phosphotransferase
MTASATSFTIGSAAFLGGVAVPTVMAFFSTSVSAERIAIIQNDPTGWAIGNLSTAVGALIAAIGIIIILRTAQTLTTNSLVRFGLRALLDAQPDLLLMDINMPELNGIEATRQITAVTPHPAILILTMFDDDTVLSAVEAGAHGYLLKGAHGDETLRAIRAVANGEAIFSSAVAKKMMRHFKGGRSDKAEPFPELTPREREILALVAAGLTNSAIAERLVLTAVQIIFLPLGADQNTAVYRSETNDKTAYFLKLRSGVFEETAVTLPHFLHDQGIRHIIAPLTTKTGQLWTRLDAFTVILYPFVDGRNGRELKLSAAQWAALGAALKKLHTLTVPPAIKTHLRQEAYSPRWREMVKMFLERVQSDAYDDSVALELAAFLRGRRAEILDLVQRAEQLAESLARESLELVLCHADIHASNVLVDGRDTLYIVDWDDPLLAPKERDLMFIGGAQGFVGYTMPGGRSAVLSGYGPATINPRALAYYRYERIIEDIALYCEQLLLSNEGGQDRAQSLRYLVSNFLPDGTIEAARRVDKRYDLSYGDTK